MKKYTKEKIELATLKGELLGVLSGLKLYIDDENPLSYLEELKQKVKELRLNPSDELYSIIDYLNFMKDVEVFKNEVLSEK
jgi:CRISPR/Cas system CSM-associated protein Csm5 (group 7 of RAMP superfamily)